MRVDEFLSQAQDFLNRLFERMAAHHMDIPKHWPIDHLCYRVESWERYEILKREFAQWSDLLIESEVHGRPIATFKLHQPISFLHSLIDLVELPAPKASKPTKEGFEHIEIVCDVPFADLEERFRHLKLDRGGLAKKINPELEICLGEYNLKFHHQSLEEVIAMELAAQAESGS